MVAFSLTLGAHNPFLGYTGDYDEAASSCFKTAIVFFVLSLISLLSFVFSAMRAKMDPIPPSSHGNYEAV